MNPLALAMLKTGLVSSEMRKQFQQWGAPVDVEGPEIPLENAEQADQILSMALESEGYVLTKVTDLDVIRSFYSTQQHGDLHLVINGLVDTVPVLFGRTSFGEIILPWRAEAIDVPMTDPDTYLEAVDPVTQVTQRTYFKDVREVFFGDVKAFMLCTVAALGDIQESVNGNV